MIVVGKDISMEELKRLMHIATPELARQIDEAEAKWTPKERLADKLHILAGKVYDISCMIEDLREEADELDTEVNKMTGSNIGTNRLSEAEDLLDTMISIIGMEEEDLLDEGE